MPDEPEVHGLLALMLLHDARREARFADGELVLLPTRTARSGTRRRSPRPGAALDRALALGGRGPYVLQAAIAVAARRGAARLGADRGALRGARPADGLAGGRAQPGGRDRRGRGARGGARDRRRPRPRRLPLPARDACRAAAPARPRRRGARGATSGRSSSSTTMPSGGLLERRLRGARDACPLERLTADRCRRIEDAVEPAVDRRGDLLPASRDHVQVRPALELEVVGLRGRAARSACTAPSPATPGRCGPSSAPTISSGARSSFLKWTSVGGCRWKFANPAS